MSYKLKHYYYQKILAFGKMQSCENGERSRVSNAGMLKPIYKSAELLDYIEAGVDALTVAFPAAKIILAGDFNALDDSEVIVPSSLYSIVNKPTRGCNVLDRVYVNDMCYELMTLLELSRPV